jgi:hypothetical protein
MCRPLEKEGKLVPPEARVAMMMQNQAKAGTLGLEGGLAPLGTKRA